MIKDQLYKRLFIPLTGAVFPFLAGLLPHTNFTLTDVFLTLVFFTAVSLAGWLGVVKLTASLRLYKPLQKGITHKLGALLLAPTGFAAVVFFLGALLWQLVALPQLNGAELLQAALIGGLGGLLLALLYEIVFLSVEKELDSRVLKQIDNERHEAEIHVLKNELDPHFFFNCMNTLSHLVQHDAAKAYQFVHKLSNVYKYFLRNKAKEYVSLQEEMDFLENYYFLLRIRYDDNIHIHKQIDEQNGEVFILPCTLQVLVENAIKHNFFSEQEPLEITIRQNGQFIIVSNPVRPKAHAADSTKVGLRNLKARYRLLSDQDVLVQRSSNKFLVKLPIVKTIQHDKSSDH